MSDDTLILDADDTLWENNVYYEDVRDAFAERMAREGFDRAAAVAMVDAVELERVPRVGYAPQEFVRSIGIAYERLCERHGLLPRAEVAAEVEAIARRVLDHPIVLLTGVAETLPALRRRFRLILLTKGDLAVQQSKVARSGLASFFHAVEVVPEKGPDVLRALVGRYGLDPQRTWMVGNSPRSDVNPALAAGLGAVYIPHPVPWDFEQTPIAAPERVIELARFSDLLHHFPGLEAQ
ncbi:MAG: HAD family hydrolase [Anaerolineae bacterium]|nr:HAD family hydrolase [Anaerolineae bacterium]